MKKPKAKFEMSVLTKGCTYYHVTRRFFKAGVVETYRPHISVALWISTSKAECKEDALQLDHKDLGYGQWSDIMLPKTTYRHACYKLTIAKAQDTGGCKSAME